MKLIALLLTIAAGHFVIQQLNDPTSDFSSTAQQVWSDIQSASDSWDGDYASTSAGRPNTSDWAARGGSSFGQAPNPQPMFGQTNDLALAKKQMDEAYRWYTLELKTFGENANNTQRARQDYLNAKYHYDALAQNAGW